jgi:uncharacterized protein Yka (UPF0111/DUF47 family)
MRRSREPMTIARLKQSMDRRFQSMDRAMDRRFARFERKKADKSDVRRLEQKVDRGFREIRQEIKDTAEETRRHFDAVVESLHDDFRLFADAIAGHTERLDRHDIRIGRLERRAQ